MKKFPFSALALFFSLVPGLFGAEITVPRLELASRGSVEEGNFGISTAAKADIALDGGYKYGIVLGLGAEIPNLEKALSYGRLELPYASSPGPSDAEYNALVDELNERQNNQAVISIRSVEAVIRDVFGKPLELGFFIGHFDDLGSGDDFPKIFGTAQVGTDLRDFLYYPEGLGGDRSLRFNGAIHSIKGTGLVLRTTFLEKIIPSLYIYQDLSFKEEKINSSGIPAAAGSYEPGHYSGDFRLLVNGGVVKLETFAGITYVNHDDPVLRGGILAFFSSDSGGESRTFPEMALLLQAGIPQWQAGETLDIDNWYFLMEPRLRFEKIGTNLTFFYHPVYYMNRIIRDEKGDEDRGRADINFKIFYGDINKSPFEGGLETTLGMRIHDGEDLSLWVSPFIRAVSSGLLWDFKIRFNPLFFSEGGDFAEGYIGIRTAY